MKTILQSFVLLILAIAPVVLAQTNDDALRAKKLEQALIERIKKAQEGGRLAPIQLTPDEDALLVKEGIMPPHNANVGEAQAAKPDPSQMMDVRMERAPLVIAVQSYETVSGKRALVDSGIGSYSISVSSSGRVTRAQALLLLQDTFKKAGLVIEDVDARTVRFKKQ